MTGGVREELFALLGALANGAIAPADHRRLEEILSQDPEARKLYFDYLDVHFGLHDWQLRDEAAEPLSALRRHLDGLPGPVEAPGHQAWVGYVLVAAAAVCASFLLQTLWRSWRPAQGSEAPRDYVATLVSTADCVWDVGDPPRREGSRLAPGEFRLLAGVVEIRFDSGAQLVIEGPAVLRIESASAASLVRGKVVLKSDETAEAFVLQTPTSTLIDRGTEYAVAVGPAGEEVHVFDGAVERKPKAKDPSQVRPEQLTAGQAKQYGSRVAVGGTPVPLGENRFVRRVPARGPTAPGSTANLLAYEGFDYKAPTLPSTGAAGGYGWAKPWTVVSSPAVSLADQGLDRDDAITAAVGGAIDVQGTAGIARQLATPIRFDRDGVYYFSFLFRRYSGDAKAPDSFAVIFRDSQNTEPQKRLVVGIGEANHILFTHFEGGGARSPLPLQFEKTYLLVGKIVAAQRQPDQVFLRVYSPEEPVRQKEPASWSVASRPVQTNLVLDCLAISVNSPRRQMLDEFRLGTTWASVTSAWAK